MKLDCVCSSLTRVCFVSQGRTHIFKIHARSMSVERDIRFELLARLCPNSTGKTDATASCPRFHVTCPLKTHIFSV